MKVLGNNLVSHDEFDVHLQDTVAPLICQTSSTYEAVTALEAELKSLKKTITKITAIACVSLGTVMVALICAGVFFLK